MHNEYGFKNHLSPEFPSQIVIDVTEFCNLACVHCPHLEFSKSEAFAGRNLDIKLHKKLIDEVARDSRGYCRYLRYTGQGEPLLHPDFVEMIKYAKKYSGVPINITTNGMLLTERMIKLFLEIGVDIFDISIDANTPKTYALVRRKGDLNVTRANALRLIELTKKGRYKTKVVISFVDQPLNHSEVSDFEEFWREAGADYVVIRIFHSCAGSKKEVAKRMKESIRGKRKPCIYPWERLILGPSGLIGFCPADWRHQSIVSPLKDSTIKEIWQGEFMAKLREVHLKNDFSLYPFCGNCLDWSIIKWPHEGRAYSDLMQELLPLDLIDT